MAPPIKSNVSIHPRLKAPHLIPALAFSHMLSNLQHPPAICQPCSPPLPKANSPACLPVPCLAAYRRSPFHHPTILSSCRRTLLHSQNLSCPLEVSSCMGKPAEPFSLVLASVVSLLWVQPCESPQGGCHTSLPTRDQRGITGTISHGHGAVNHWVHKQDHKCRAKFQLVWNLWVCVNDSCVSDSLMMPSLHYLTKRLLCKTNKSKLLSQLCCTAGCMSPKQHQARHFIWRQFPAAWIRSGKIRHEQRKCVREMTSRQISTFQQYQTFLLWIPMQADLFSAGPCNPGLSHGKAWAEAGREASL